MLRDGFSLHHYDGAGAGEFGTARDHRVANFVPVMLCHWVDVGAIGPHSGNSAYALFNQELNRFEKARIAYERCLEWAKKYREIAKLALTLNNLGKLDRAQNRMEEARKEFEEALKIRRELAQENPDTYLPDVAL
jgi:tetratricopeptide (TPR) repeat protein